MHLILSKFGIGYQKVVYNAWGWGMDDVLLLPWLRRLTMIKGIEYPAKVAAYMAATTDELCDYTLHAV